MLTACLDCSFRLTHDRSSYSSSVAHKSEHYLQRPTLHRVTMVVRGRSCRGGKLFPSSFGERTFPASRRFVGLASRYSRYGQQTRQAAARADVLRQPLSTASPPNATLYRAAKGSSKIYNSLCGVLVTFISPVAYHVEGAVNLGPGNCNRRRRRTRPPRRRNRPAAYRTSGGGLQGCPWATSGRCSFAATGGAC